MITKLLHGFDDPWMMALLLIIGLILFHMNNRKMMRAEFQYSSIHTFWGILVAALFFSGFWNLIKLWLDSPAKPC